MHEPTRQQRPGYLFIERYMPTATEPEREEAYENLLGVIAILVEIDLRLEREESAQSDSRESVA